MHRIEGLSSKLAGLREKAEAMGALKPHQVIHSFVRPHLSALFVLSSLMMLFFLPIDQAWMRAACGRRGYDRGRPRAVRVDRWCLLPVLPCFESRGSTGGRLPCVGIRRWPDARCGGAGVSVSDTFLTRSLMIHPQALTGIHSTGSVWNQGNPEVFASRQQELRDIPVGRVRLDANSPS